MYIKLTLNLCPSTTMNILNIQKKWLSC